MPKQLKIWNGRSYTRPYQPKSEWERIKYTDTPHLYICAYSLADAARICEEYFGIKPSYREMKDYWSPNCWGEYMEEITPERGLWIIFKYGEKPIKVI